MANNEELQVIIGLEIHIQLTKLKTKMFCSCTSGYRGMDPNTATCEVCLALPGTLPVLNEKAVDYAILLAQAVDSEVQQDTFFFRKNYYYPDMAKNFQISQYDKAGGVPIAIGGKIPVCPSGGFACFGEATMAQGFAQVYEMVLQLRDQCKDRQVEGAKIGMSEVYGAAGNNAAVILKV